MLPPAHQRRWFFIFTMVCSLFSTILIKKLHVYKVEVSVTKKLFIIVGSILTRESCPSHVDNSSECDPVWRLKILILRQLIYIISSVVDDFLSGLGKVSPFVVVFNNHLDGDVVVLPGLVVVSRSTVFWVFSFQVVARGNLARLLFLIVFAL